VKLVAALEPKLTALAPVKPVPVTTTGLAPTAAGQGLSALTARRLVGELVGRVVALVPAGVVT